MSRWGFPSLPIALKPTAQMMLSLLEILTQNIDYFKSKPVNIALVTILLDHGYHPDYLTQKLEEVYPQIMAQIQFELAPKPSQH